MIIDDRDPLRIKTSVNNKLREKNIAFKRTCIKKQKNNTSL